MRDWVSGVRTQGSSPGLLPWQGLSMETPVGCISSFPKNQRGALQGRIRMSFPSASPAIPETLLQRRGQGGVGPRGSIWESCDPAVTAGICPLFPAGSCVRWGRPSPASTQASWRSVWQCVGLSSWPDPPNSITSWWVLAIGNLPGHGPQTAWPWLWARLDLCGQTPSSLWESILQHESTALEIWKIGFKSKPCCVRPWLRGSCPGCRP